MKIKNESNEEIEHVERMPLISYLYNLQPFCNGQSPVSILHKSIAGRYRPVRAADGPITARCRFIKNASWEPK